MMPYHLVMTHAIMKMISRQQKAASPMKAWKVISSRLSTIDNWSLNIVAIASGRSTLCKDKYIISQLRQDIVVQLNIWQLMRQGLFYEELSFQHYLQHYSGTGRSTEIQSCLQIHRQICCDKMSSVAIKSYKY